MVTIRLSPYGKRGAVIYRIVATSSIKKVKGTNLDVIGWWNPMKDEKKIDKKKLEKWQKNGAKVSEAVWKIL